MVNYKHQSYLNYYDKWVKCRDVFAGDEQLKKNSKRYIPKLDGQTDEQYKEVINRESFENYTGKTADGITGLIFAKNPQIEYGSKIKLIQDNIDLAGASIIDLAQTTVNEVIEVGRAGL